MLHFEIRFLTTWLDKAHSCVSSELSHSINQLTRFVHVQILNKKVMLRNQDNSTVK